METIGYFDSSHEMPEEIVTAAGFVPYKILGSVQEPTDAADRYLPAFSCPAARSWLTEALVKSGQWAGIVVAQGCNATNRHYDVWKMHVETPFLYWFNCPAKRTGSAVRFLKKELQRLIQGLEERFKVRITDDGLKKAIAGANAVKSRLRTLSALRDTRDVPNGELLKVLFTCLQQERNRLVPQLDRLIEAWQRRDPFPAGKKRILLTGSDVTYVEWMELLDECGLRVVRDDLSIGERYFSASIPEDGDPLDALVRYYMSIPVPATRPGLGERIDHLRHMLDDTQVDGVVSQNLKFCEPYAYDAVLVKEALEAKGVRVIHLERQFTALEDQQAANRLMAFAELL